MPRFANEIEVIDDVSDSATRIRIRGSLEALKRKQPGLFGDGAIGATAHRLGLPIVTGDKRLAQVLESMGLEVRRP